jgi:hypothetical protein
LRRGVKWDAPARECGLRTAPALFRFGAWPSSAGDVWTFTAPSHLRCVPRAARWTTSEDVPGTTLAAPEPLATFGPSLCPHTVPARQPCRQQADARERHPALGLRTAHSSRRTVGADHNHGRALILYTRSRPLPVAGRQIVQASPGGGPGGERRRDDPARTERQFSARPGPLGSWRTERWQLTCLAYVLGEERMLTRPPTAPPRAPSKRCMPHGCLRRLMHPPACLGLL